VIASTLEVDMWIVIYQLTDGKWYALPEVCITKEGADNLAEKLKAIDPVSEIRIVGCGK